MSTSAQHPVTSGRSGRIALLALTAAIAALVAVIWVLPGMLDWNRYRASIAALVSAGLGRPVQIDGDITLHLLPQPILTATSLKLNDAGDGLIMAAHELRLRVALVPLLGGRVDARELTLRGADLRLPWPPPPGALNRRPPAWLTGLQARVEESRLQVGDFVASDVDASLGSDPDTGTLTAAGSGKLVGLTWRFTAGLGRPGRDGAAPLDVSLDGQGKLRDTGGTFSGVIGADGGLSGRVAARGPDLSQVIPAPAVTWRGDGRLSAASGLAVADELALEIGGSPARGAVALRVQPDLRLDLALSAGRMDLDAWVPVLLRATQAGQTPAVPTGIDPSAVPTRIDPSAVPTRIDPSAVPTRIDPSAVPTRIDPSAVPTRIDPSAVPTRIDPSAVLTRIDPSVVPAGIDLSAVPTGIDLSAEASNLAGGTIRQLRTAFDIDAGGVSLRELSALLPGDAKLALQGRFPRGRNGTTFEGTAGLIAPDLRATLRWLEPFVPALLRPIPGAALRTANLSAKVAVDPPQVSLSDLKGLLDGAAAQGGLAVRLGARPTVSAGLSLDRLLLDPWLSEPGLLVQPQALYTSLSRLVTGAGFDADVKLQLRRAAWRGAEFGPVSIDAQTEGGRLTVRRLEATALDMRATASGTLGEGGRVSEGRLEFNTPDISPLRALLPPELLPTPAVLRGPASALVQLSGPPDALGVRAMVEVNDVRADVQPTINMATRRWSGPIAIHHPGAPRLLEQLGFPGTAAWLGDGSFSVIAQLAAAGAGRRLDVSNIEFVAGELRATGQLTMVGHAVTGKLQADTLPLPLPYPRSPDPLPLALLRDVEADIRIEAARVLLDLVPAVQQFGANLAIGRGVAALRAITAKLSGGTLGGSVAVELGERPRVVVQGQAHDVAVTGPLFGGTLDVTSGMLGAQVDLASEGYSPAALAATLAGSGTIEIRNASVAGFDLGSAQVAFANPVPAQLTASLRAALRQGSTPVQLLQVPFRAQRGIVALQAVGQTASGGVALGGTVDVSGGMLDGRLTLQPGAGLPDLSARLAGPAASPSRTPELAGVARWLAERP